MSHTIVALAAALMAETSCSRTVGVRELVTELGDRPIEARLTDADYRPLRDALRGPAAIDLTLSARVALANLERGAEAQDTPQAAAALGAGYLLVDRVDEGLAALAEALSRQPGNARFRSDVAAAYLARARLRNRAVDLVSAVASAGRALRAQPSLREAAFNRALALEKLSLAPQAAAAWRDYAAADRESGWGREAERRAASLAASIDRHDWQPPREPESLDSDAVHRLIELASARPAAAAAYVAEVMLPTWARMHSENRPDLAQAWLREADHVAAVVADRAGDPQVRDEVRVIAANQSAPAALNELAGAHRAYQRARALAASERMSEAAVQYERAAVLLNARRSPLRLDTDFYLAFAAYLGSRNEEALSRFEALARKAVAAGYPLVGGRAHHLAGLILRTAGRFDLAVAHLTSALELSSGAADFDNAALSHVELAATFDQLGEHNDAWRHRQQALTVAPLIAPRTLHVVLILSARACLEQKLPEAALEFQRAAAANARDSAQPGLLVETNIALAKTLFDLGDAAEGMRSIAVAERALASVPDVVFANRWRPDVSETRAALELLSRPAAAAEEWSNAIQGFATEGRHYRLVAGYLNRARASRRVGNVADARQDLDRAAGIFEAQWAALPRDPSLLYTFARAWDVYDDLVDLSIASGDTAAALRYAERSKARGLLGTIRGNAATPVDPSALSSRLPDDVAVLFYRTLRDRVCVWILRRGSASLVQTRMTTEAMTRLTTAVRGRHREIAAGQLYDLLIRPASASIRPLDTLVIVADPPFEAVSFGALYDRVAMKYLIEQHALMYAASATLLVRDSAALASRGVSSDALVVGVATTKDGDSDLPTLPDAEREAREVAALYRQSDLLVGSAATRDAFLSRLGTRSVVHFAGHAVSDIEAPWLSRLLFSPGAVSTSSILLRDVAAMNLGRTTLVVLGACSTANPEVPRSEGAASFVRAFAAAGVPAIVGTLWDAPDRASRLVLREFHRRVQVGEPFPQALRAAQLGLLRSDDASLRDPSQWGGFALTGGIDTPHESRGDARP
jgi:CHAT domain-containing protein